LPLPWFRRQKGKAEDAPIEAAVPTAEPELELAPVAESAADGLQPTTPRKRRRGSRGGRGRKKSPATAAAGAESVAKPAAERASAPAEKADAEPKQSERKGRAARSPRRTAPRRAPLPKAKRELLISVDPGEKRVAVLEDGVVAEVYLERPEHRSIAGNIYLGTVDNVLPGMEAAFVEIGLEKNGFLYVDEIVGPELEGRKGARKIQDLIQRGQTVLVQAVKDPMKTKGARLTTEISLPGRFVVFVPHGDGLGVSRRLDDDERNRLKAIVKGIAPKTGGVIVRTAAEGASAEDVARDLDFLMRLWSTIEASAKKAKSPALIYQEAELPLRVTRDLFTGDFERLLVDHDRTHKRIVGYLKKTSPHMVERVTRYKEREPLLEAFGVEQEIKSTLSRRVDLPSGGYLIFDYAEAFTVIDVNTGRFVGSRSKRNGPGRLEDTITKNNLEAVKEVVRQLRLRDVGGIIVIDFIDMANPKNRQQVEDALRQELERDRTKTYVVEISPLGLVEMTRQNVTDGPREVMTRKCPTCDGDGIIVSESTAAVEVERRIRGLVTPGSRAKAFKVELNAKVAELLVGLDGSRIQELEEVTKRRFFFVGVENVHLDHMRVIDQGTVEKLAPSAPVEPGQELELKLGEVGLHDPRAGAGKVKGFEVVVAGAAKLVGKRVQVRITAVLEDVAYAVLTTAQEGATVPITAEAEAEKPTRVKRPSKATAADVDSDADAEIDEDVDVDVDADAEIEAEAEELDEDAIPTPRAPRKPAASRSAAPRSRRKPAAADGDEVEAGASDEPPAPKRPRTRKPAVAAATEASEAVEAVDEDAEPDAEGADGETAAPAKKRTRRGTRGGRNRKRKPTAVTNGDGEAEPIAEDPEETAETGSEEPTAPVIHLPERDLGRNGDGAEGQDDAAGGESGAQKRPTRRGSRGGRNRRKPAGAAAETEAPAEATTEVVATAEPEGEWTYTPMSEWDQS
jgi:ribonuclease G